MEKTAKIFNLSVEEIGIIKEVQETYGYKQQVQALRHILMAYKKMESEEEKYKKVAGEVLKEFEKKYGESWKRLYMSVRQTDKKNTIMQDAINWIIYNLRYLLPWMNKPKTSCCMKQLVRYIKYKNVGLHARCKVSYFTIFLAST